MSGKRQTNQQQLASGTDGRGETPVAATRGAEPSVAMTMTESLAFPEHLMEEVCSCESLQRAWKRVQENKSCGIPSRPTRRVVLTCTMRVGGAARGDEERLGRSSEIITALPGCWTNCARS
jgi:hypothetical protein